jgi:hypothetical protein
MDEKPEEGDGTALAIIAHRRLMMKAYAIEAESTRNSRSSETPPLCE